MNKPELTPEATDPKHFRRLKSNELVTRGDFVLNDQQEYDLWEGPLGFRADAFVRPIYRPDEARSIAAM
jgi:hypothetical protein